MNIKPYLLPVLLLFLAMSATAYEEPDFPELAKADRIILLHGIGRTSLSMVEISRKAKDAGYEVHNLNYHSTRDTLATIIRDTHKDYDHIIGDEARRLHFICYSLGCLVTRGIIEQHRPANLGRVAMLGPPNQGSEMADWLKDHSLANWLFGPNLPQLGTANRRVLLKLIGDSADYELGIIAGKDWIDPVGASIIPGDNDGRVSVERTRLPGMKAHKIVGVSHTGLLMNDDVIADAIHFIQHGAFTRESY